MKSDPGAIQTLKSRLNIADVVRRYLALKPAGGSRFMGLCPFHGEKTASFSVNPEKGVFYCFGCQASGDVIDFYCRINGLGFREGLEQLAREAGIALAEFKADPAEEKRLKLRQAANDMNALARDFFRETLRGPAGIGAREYLERRGVSQEMAERFQLGYSPADFHGLENALKRKGFKGEDAAAAGLLVRGDDGRQWDRFRDRLMFPIHEISGKVVAFGGRVMGPGEPKYLNSSDSAVYKKGDHLYGLSQARVHFSKAGRALLTEGYLDVIALHQHGFPEAVGALGTALTQKQAQRLTGLTRRVALVFDGDQAGEKAALRGAQMLLSQGADCSVVLLPQGEDADSVLKSGGAEAFQACLDKASEGLAFCLATVRRTKAAKDLADWALDFLDELASDAVRAAMLTRLSHGLGLGEHELRQMAVRRARERRGGAGKAEASAAGPQRTPVPSALAKKDAQVLELAIRFPEYIPKLGRAGVLGALSTDRARVFWRLLEQYGKEALIYLDERQKSFWGRAVMLDPGDGRDAAAEAEARWRHVAEHIIEPARVNRRGEELTEAIRQAYEQGDQAEVARLSKSLSDLVGEKSE